MSERDLTARHDHPRVQDDSSKLLRSTIDSLLKAADDIKALATVLEQNKRELEELKAHRIRLEARIASLEEELGSYAEGIIPPGDLN